jgi:hypothetical protein
MDFAPRLFTFKVAGPVLAVLALKATSIPDE